MLLSILLLQQHQLFCMHSISVQGIFNYHGLNNILLIYYVQTLIINRSNVTYTQEVTVTHILQLQMLRKEVTLLFRGTDGNETELIYP